MEAEEHIKAIIGITAGPDIGVGPINKFLKNEGYHDLAKAIDSTHKKRNLHAHKPDNGLVPGRLRVALGSIENAKEKIKQTKLTQQRANVDNDAHADPPEQVSRFDAIERKLDLILSSLASLGGGPLSSHDSDGVGSNCSWCGYWTPLPVSTLLSAASLKDSGVIVVANDALASADPLLKLDPWAGKPFPDPSRASVRHHDAWSNWSMSANSDLEPVVENAVEEDVEEKEDEDDKQDDDVVENKLNADLMHADTTDEKIKGLELSISDSQKVNPTIPKADKIEIVNEGMSENIEPEYNAADRLLESMYAHSAEADLRFERTFELLKSCVDKKYMRHNIFV